MRVVVTQLRFMGYSHRRAMAAVATEVPSDVMALLYQFLNLNLQCGAFVSPFLQWEQ